jgi:hypothetical protein
LPFELPWFGCKTTGGAAFLYAVRDLTSGPRGIVSANPQVPESANVKASAIVVSFIVVSFVVQIRDNRSITNKTSVKLPMWPTVHNTADLVLSG